MSAVDTVTDSSPSAGPSSETVKFIAVVPALPSATEAFEIDATRSASSSSRITTVRDGVSAVITHPAGAGSLSTRRYSNVSLPSRRPSGNTLVEISTSVASAGITSVLLKVPEKSLFGVATPGPGGGSVTRGTTSHFTVNSGCTAGEMCSCTVAGSGALASS
jgi:hypothetical protein